ncbi:MAG: helix-turn-helix domain-containing protein [Armatimonadetes bacterium]|nr:helix-turn-helix domain-containing protein [Armatimonadota bacterium]
MIAGDGPREMAETSSYTIAEVAEITGLHRNTVRQKIRLGQLQAETYPGKYGEEYRISQAALAEAGLLDRKRSPANPPAGGAGAAREPAPAAPAPAAQESTPPEPVAGSVSLESTPATVTVPATSAPAEAEPVAAPDPTAALLDLFQRHEQAIYRLGYVQGELERVKTLAERAESLYEQTEQHKHELAQLRAELEAARREAEAAGRLRQELEQARRQAGELEEMRGHLAQMAEEVNRLRTTSSAARRPWWRFWDRSCPPDGARSS